MIVIIPRCLLILKNDIHRSASFFITYPEIRGARLVFQIASFDTTVFLLLKIPYFNGVVVTGKY